MTRRTVFLTALIIRHCSLWRSLVMRMFCAAIAIMALPAVAATQPNIVFLLADDLGWSDLECYGSSFHKTPNINQLAKDGVRFTTFYAAGAVCSPTRASILTGKYPVRTGITDWIPGQKVNGRKLEQLHPRTELAREEFTLAEAFQAGGYQTIYIGKWHLGGKNLQPTDQGFDQYISDGEGEEHDSDKDDGKLERRRQSTEKFTKASMKFLEERDGKKPFLLFLSYHDVHTPIQPLPGLVEPYERKLKELAAEPPHQVEHDGRTRMRQDNPAYASMVAALDQSVGRLRRKLEELHLANNTIVIFTSDNGGLATAKNGGPTSNSPLRAGKGWLYEGGIRIPLIVHAPGITQGRTVVETAFISNDFYPTLLDLSGLPLKPEQHPDGLSFAGPLRGKRLEPARTLFWHYPHYHGSTWTPGAAVRNGDWKLVEFYDYAKVELYNLKQDPFETKDLAVSSPAKKRELLEQLRSWQKSVSAPMPVPNAKIGTEQPAPLKKKSKKKS